ncbi:Por secretion system C-terminal sorting domain-containing protein [Soonwooa buanensis]|uniref:Por secretion system C-terminal sorting domain-containing protein n=1 Tax=Soonwooa buanensis TaxID=619805 RepID=A0A1T5CLH9_9FLAO|nr:T9SS type A sorting domain-containing protein [Soonwooa buanensis]SKB60348.1 Por secretion system C-terminal sorting domain-containing protein [Soonwooa buanensis]
MKKKLLSLVLILSWIFSFAEVPQSEKQALYAIAESIHYSYNWNEQTPIEQWAGITINKINGNDHVTGLFLPINANGSNYDINFSNQIHNLLYLEDASIRYNFPSSSNITFNFDFNHLIELSRLKTFNLSTTFDDHNPKDKLLNVDKISQLTNLEKLIIKFQDANFKIPSSISALAKLKILYYDNILDDTYTPEIFQLSLLENLTIKNNIYYVQESANAISNLNQLKSLTLNGKFGSLPDGFYNIPNLESLYLTSNSYSLSDNIGNYSNKLKTLSVEGLNLNRSVIGSLVNLEKLYLKSSTTNNIISSSIAQLQQLKVLSVSTTMPYPIYFPNEISQLTNLKELYVYSSKAPISEVIYTIPNLKLLLLHTNQNVSENVGNLQKLERLQVYNDGNVTALPVSLGNIHTLKVVDFGISGSVNNTKLLLPEGYFTNWPNLQQFWSMHTLAGDITNRFMNNPDLEMLSFDAYNTTGNLEGKLNLCQNPKLAWMDVAKSNITEVDLRNVQSISNSIEQFTFSESKISKFIVDDVEQFNSLVNSGKIIIESNTPSGYSVVTSSEPCLRKLSLNDAQLEKTLVYPNPVQDFLTFRTNKNIEDVEIISVSGQKTKVESYDNKVNLSMLPSGLYIIKWSEDGFYRREKILKK